MANSAVPEHDLDLISKATGLLTIELAFGVVFMYGSLTPTDYGDQSGGLMRYESLAIVTTVVILNALLSALLCAAATLVAVARDSSLANRFIRMSAGLLGLSGLALGVHVSLNALEVYEWTTDLLIGMAISAAVVSLLLTWAWRLSGVRVA